MPNFIDIVAIGQQIKNDQTFDLLPPEDLCLLAQEMRTSLRELVEEAASSFGFIYKPDLVWDRGYYKANFQLVSYFNPAGFCQLDFLIRHGVAELHVEFKSPEIGRFGGDGSPFQTMFGPGNEFSLETFSIWIKEAILARDEAGLMEAALQKKELVIVGGQLFKLIPADYDEVTEQDRQAAKSRSRLVSPFMKRL